MELTLLDRWEITDAVNRHGHLSDAGAFDRFGEIMTEDVEDDTTDLGGGVSIGFAGMGETALALRDVQPVAHLVTNVVVGESVGDEVPVVSKALGVARDGAVAALTYEDRFVRTGAGWRLARRRITRRREAFTFYNVPPSPPAPSS